MGFEAANAAHDFFANLRVGHAHVHFHRRRVWHHVGPCAALDQAHADSELARVVGHRLQGQDLVRDFVDGVATEVMFYPGMRRQAMGCNRKVGAPLTRRDNLPTRASRLGNKHELGTPGLPLYEFTRGETAHLFIADHQVSDRQMRSPTF